MSSTTPTCYTVIRDPATRRKISDSLAALGWSVIQPPTGLDLIHELSGSILGDRPSRPVDLIVVDEAAPGCRGSTIARGLRELGISIPVAVIDGAAPPRDDPEQRVFVLEPPLAPFAVQAIALRQRPGARTVAAA